MTYYAELAAQTNFSFLHGASHPEELVERARELELDAIGIADRNSLAGVVRAHVAAKAAAIKLLVGARLVLQEGVEIVCYPHDRQAYGRLSRLLSIGKLRGAKGECHLWLEDVLAASEGQAFIVIPPDRIDADFEVFLGKLLSGKPDQVWLAARYTFHGPNRERIGRLFELGERYGVPLVASNDVLYHVPNRRPLQDVVTCIREHCRLETAGGRLEANAERHLKPADEMARLFRGFEQALLATRDIVLYVNFSLEELVYEYPDEPIPKGSTPQRHLEALTQEGADWRYPKGVPQHVRKQLAKELQLIDELSYAPYFLTVHDIVAWARKQRILCQGRGSAANSAVCYCLGITSVDPANTSLLFERFLSKERKEPPDIDVDFEHERREEVIQYVYHRYGRHRSALTATVISYRSRSAIRDVCKVLGLTEDISTAITGSVWGGNGSDLSDSNLRKMGLNPHTPLLRRALKLAQELIGFPRHLSQHVGGFVLTRGPLVETIPIGNAAMPDRTFIEWNKDDINTLGIMKVDILALGMLTCIRKAFELLKTHKGISLSLASIPADDPETYDMLCAGDSLGVFQVESRAQMNMLPRLRPRCFYDLVIEVAIVRPGPIQGDMVHPYLRRRKKKEQICYPAPAPEHGPPDELERILKRTLGVPLFQEQAMQISIDAAKFTPDEANGLRRAMATFRKVGTIQNYEEMMVSRMISRGYEAAFAKRCFDQVKGFGEYGFPESHAASFALLVYVSSWLKCHHPDVFCAALLNSQPMGFYAPAQIVRDAQEHGVEIRPVDVNYSDWDVTLEPSQPDSTCLAVRLGFGQVDGLGKNEMEALMRERGQGYLHIEDLKRTMGLCRRSIELLAAADSFNSINLSRRQALWNTRGLSEGKSLPLFECADINDQGAEKEIDLPIMPISEHVIQDYQTTRLSLKSHPLVFLRQSYGVQSLLTTSEATSHSNGQRISTAGIVLVRQRPGSANGIVFVTIEDETGIANIVIWKRVMERFRSVVMGARLLEVRGRVQAADNIVHIVAEELIDRTHDLNLLSEEHRTEISTRSANYFTRHPRAERAVPKSRDFH